MMVPSTKPGVALVAEEPFLRRELENALNDDYNILKATSHDEAYPLLEQGTLDVLVLDIGSGGDKIKSGLDLLEALGASEILLRTEIEFGEQPLLTARWAGAIDNAGGPLLTWLLRALLPGGSVASVGLAGSADLHCTVMPFILRGANLLGVGSAGTPRAAREALWQRISTDLKPRHLDRIVTRTLSFDELPAAFEDYIAGRITGRTVVRIS